MASRDNIVHLGSSSRRLLSAAIPLLLATCAAVAGCQPAQDTPSSGVEREPDAAPRLDPSNALLVNDLYGRWQMVSLNDKPVVVADEAETQVWINFGSPCYDNKQDHCNSGLGGAWEPSERHGGRLSFRGYSGCNWFGAEAKVADGRLLSEPVLSTERACTSTADQEARIQRLLSEEPALFVRGDMLELSLPKGDRLVAVQSPK